VLSDEALLLTLLRNLVENARKASPEGGVVTVSGAVEGGRYRLCVQDNGCGMDQETLLRATEAFYMKDNARVGQGAGLGLSICQKICDAHGTQLHIQSALGRGTNISFLLEVYHG
jgi:signal transduction histidine kinase